MVRLFREMDWGGGFQRDVEYMGQPALTPKFKDGYPLYFLSDGKLQSMIIPSGLAEEFMKEFGHSNPNDVTPDEITAWLESKKIR
jgi:hypothetical protein